MKSILDAQLEEDNLKRLAAQRVLYDRAKFIRTIKLLGMICFSVAGPLLTYKFSSSAFKSALTLGSSLFSLVVFIALRNMEASCLALAASIQEQFDTSVFSLPWNKSLGSEPQPEKVAYYSRKVRKRESLENWYPVKLGTVEHWKAVTICQRINLAWDASLQRPIALSYLWLGILLIIADGVAAVALSMTAKDAIVAIVLPSVTPLLAFLDEGLKHYGTTIQKESMLQSLTSDLKDTEPGKFTEAKCRQNQDLIWRTRTSQPPTPGFIYWFYRKSDEEDMNWAVQQFASSPT
jgi:hypothetical protein